MTSAHLYIKPQTKTIHAEHTYNIYNIRYNITSNAMLAWQLHSQHFSLFIKVEEKTVSICVLLQGLLSDWRKKNGGLVRFIVIGFPSKLWTIWSLRRGSTINTNNELNKEVKPGTWLNWHMWGNHPCHLHCFNWTLPLLAPPQTHAVHESSPPAMWSIWIRSEKMQRHTYTMLMSTRPRISTILIIIIIIIIHFIHSQTNRYDMHHNSWHAGQRW